MEPRTSDMGRVLVVDDHHTFAELLAGALENSGMTARAVARVLGITLEPCRARSLHSELRGRSQSEAVRRGRRLVLLGTADAH